jgi:hypothetical protein
VALTKVFDERPRQKGSDGRTSSKACTITRILKNAALVELMPDNYEASLRRQTHFLLRDMESIRSSIRLRSATLPVTAVERAKNLPGERFT